MLDVALFPIPNVVAFPGTVVPLHVFEPRYRQLVHDCVRDQRLVGVSHTVKTIHQPPKRQTPEQALRSNQATYKPQEVFSAGVCEILDTTSDGRLLATVTMQQRLTLVKELQSLPYRIVSCSPLEDSVESVADSDNRMLQECINDRLIALIGDQHPDIAAQLNDPEWLAVPPAEFSFSIFRFLRFDPDMMQRILETQSVNVRLETIWDLLRRG